MTKQKCRRDQKNKGKKTRKTKRPQEFYINNLKKSF